MIALTLKAVSNASAPYVTRLSRNSTGLAGTSRLERLGESRSLWCSEEGLLEIVHDNENLEGDVVLVDPFASRVERLIRFGSQHNTLLVTEQCDQLCVMCSQPPKKSHNDRYDHFEAACLLAEQGATIGISGGEPTLHLERLLEMIEMVLERRPDLLFHVLTNAQHFEKSHIQRLSTAAYRNVIWGVPLYSVDPPCHDAIVGKPGAFERLMKSFHYLCKAGARIELRTVMMTTNANRLDRLAYFVALNLPYIEQWSMMDLENAGFARTRFDELKILLPNHFTPIAAALDRAALHGVPVRIFNVPLCHIPAAYRHFAVASISDWKQRFAPACEKCSVKRNCSGFFEWHPDELVGRVKPL